MYSVSPSPESVSVILRISPSACPSCSKASLTACGTSLKSISFSFCSVDATVESIGSTSVFACETPTVAAANNAVNTNFFITIFFKINVCCVCFVY
ncbi:MAG: IPT/TIG domain-containing protein [Flavobacteriaceae bacterium]